VRKAFRDNRRHAQRRAGCRGRRNGGTSASVSHCWAV